MFGFAKIFGTKNDREIRRMRKMVARITAIEPELEALSDEQLQGKTPSLRARLEGGEHLDAVLPEAFATVREASKRVMGMRHFDVQLIGGMTLHENRIAEMRTGEGKTLMATLPAYLNALTGRGVHVVTVNDYLAERDANWMKPLYEFLGLTVGVVFSRQPPEEKRAAYAADITYGTNNEFGFDYLRDNMALRAEDRFQRHLNMAIVDEVDSILIDEARTPLIISGPSEDSSKLYKRINALIPRLKLAEEVESSEPEAEPELQGHYTVDEKTKQVELTEEGHEFVESMLVQEGLLAEGDSLYAAVNLGLLQHVNSGLRAHALYRRDVDYIVQNGQVVIVDEHTGRTMPGRRWSDGMHQAVEAKEGVAIQSENQTLASTTFQNYFRLYDKLAGMTGTADTEAFEFRQIYGLDVVVIPTNKPMVRQDMNDLIFMSIEEKFEAIIEAIQDAVKNKQPVLVGTASIETSEYVSSLLKKSKIDHKVLNAKYHQQEADIIAQAGRPSAVTIATNMAGRGTDIVLGGNVSAAIDALEDPSDEKIAAIKEQWEKDHATVLEAGGLFIVGTERHESRRIDNQLRGRAGRQGDPGRTLFYLSLEDKLMRIFASDRVKSMMQALGMERGEAIEHRWVTKSIEKAQRKVEGHNFDLRKQLLEYDDVANEQRRVIYEQRNEILEADSIEDTIVAIRKDVVDGMIDNYIPPGSVDEQWDIPGLEQALEGEFRLPLPVQQWLDEDKQLYEDNLRERILQSFVTAYEEKEKQVDTPDAMRQLEKHFMLTTLDRLWKEHLSNMDNLRQGIHLRGYAQRNPKQEYKREAFELFQEMLENVKFDVVRILSLVELQRQEEVEALETQAQEQAEEQAKTMKTGDSLEPETGDTEAKPVKREERKVGRNEPCPCGSGKKYKHCCGKVG